MPHERTRARACRGHAAGKVKASIPVSNPLPPPPAHIPLRDDEQPNMYRTSICTYVCKPQY